MSRQIWSVAFAWLLAAFFVVGATVNIAGSEATLEEYRRWGYPAWFHSVTGALELTTAALLVFSATRLAGSAVGAAVMTAAAATVLLHGEPLHSLAPLTVLALLGLNAWVLMRR